MSSTLHNLKTNVLKEISTPYEKLLMIVLGILFIVSGIYELSLYPDGSGNMNSIEGLFLLIISFRILSGDTVLGNFHCSLPLAILGAIGIAVSVVSLLVPTIMTEVVGTISGAILFVYAIVCMIAPIIGKNKETPLYLLLCFIFGTMLLLITLNNLGLDIFSNYNAAGLTLTAMGFILIMMALLRTGFIKHDNNEFPVISLTVLLTGLSLFCCIIAIIICNGDQNVYSITGSMAVFMMAIGVKIISIGNTPFGNIRRSRLAIGLGIFCISLTMVAVILPIETLKTLLSYTLGTVNILGGLYIANQIVKKHGLPHKMPIRFSIAFLSMLLFGFNRLFPGIFAGDLLMPTLILFAFVMTSVGATIFSISISNYEKQKKDNNCSST